MTIARTYIPDPPPSEHAQPPPSLSGANLKVDDPVWAAARRSYVQGCSTPVVAERHGLNERTVRRRAAEEGWAEMRRRMRAAEEERRRRSRLAGEPETEEEAFARAPELEDFVAAHSFEVGELLLRPGARRLSRFALRRAAEMAAQGRPVEAGAWLRLVTGVERVADRLREDETAFSPADHIRARYAAELRQAFMADGDEDAAPDEEGEGGLDGEGG